MDPIRPTAAPVPPQAVAKVMPLGRGWMLLALETGFALRNTAEGVEQRLRPEEAEALRKGEITPEALAARFGGAHHQPAAGAVTVAFSAEAMRLSGQTGPRAKARAKAGAEAPPPAQGGRWRMEWIGVALAALLVLVLIWAM
ncbi:hypothetical protein [Paragemmobacter straminiformis]|uniref:Uncharacterized protein n=1 Tax=Paragemmobacter straminiformis TaxID=2045119 RepID=A0A842I5Y9_9RHOB|nr:hypothetical protein [Gemmobacter straminiformis]MBC2835046.1 hypothetical protein [Gemmobacter straminiformis]